MSALPVLPVIIPPGDAYACTACGSCCRRPWTVGISDEERARYAAIDWAEHAPHLRGVEPWRRFGDRAWVLARDATGACVFLEPDGRCVIHRVLGYEQKPQSCQAFPYTFVETPSGVRTRLSWVTEGRRLGEAPSAEMVEALAPAFERDRAAHATASIDDEAALARTDRLGAFVASHEELDVVERVLRVLTALAVRGAPDAARVDLLNVTKRLARDLATGRFAPPHLAPAVALETIARVRFSDDPESRGAWTAFVRDLVFDGLAHGGVRGQAEWIVRGFAHARWLAKWVAAKDGRAEVTARDVRWALAEAEAFRGPHWGVEGRLARRLGRGLAELEARALLLDQLFRVEV